MDFQNRAGSKPGSGGVLSSQETAVARRERLRKLAMETIDLAKDPYLMKNHLGSFECKLCLTLHTNEGWFSIGWLFVMISYLIIDYYESINIWLFIIITWLFIIITWLLFIIGYY